MFNLIIDIHIMVYKQVSKQSLKCERSQIVIIVKLDMLL